MLPSVSELPLEASERDDDDLHFIDPHPIPEPYNHFTDWVQTIPTIATGTPFVRLVDGGAASVQLIGGGGAGGSGVSIPWNNTTTTNTLPATTGWIDWGNQAGSYSSAMEVRYNALPIITDPNSFITVTATA